LSKAFYRAVVTASPAFPPDAAPASAPVPGPVSGVPERPPVRTLAEALRAFVTHGSPWALAVTVLVAAAGLATSPLRPAQLLVVAAVLAAQPFVEWLIHVVVLHARPFTLLGRPVDLYQARKHRAHHADPRDLDILLIPLRGHLAGAVVLGGLCALLPDAATRWALVGAVAASSLAYEWVHFLVHTDYKPRRAPYRRLYVHHRLHHYRNEHYWFGVSRLAADRLLGTAPAKADVERSETVLTLGLEDGGSQLSRVLASHSAGKNRRVSVDRR
jgi:hypothetical protein